MIRAIGWLGQINKKGKHRKWFPVQYFLNDMASLYKVVIYGGMVWVAYGQKKKDHFCVPPLKPDIGSAPLTAHVLLCQDTIRREVTN